MTNFDQLIPEMRDGNNEAGGFQASDSLFTLMIRQPSKSRIMSLHLFRSRQSLNESRQLTPGGPGRSCWTQLFRRSCANR